MYFKGLGSFHFFCNYIESLFNTTSAKVTFKGSLFSLFNYWGGLVEEWSSALIQLTGSICPSTFVEEGIFLNENKKSLPLTIGTGFLEEVFILNVLYFHSTSSFPFSYDFLPNLLAIEDQTGNN